LFVWEGVLVFDDEGEDVSVGVVGEVDEEFAFLVEFKAVSFFACDVECGDAALWGECEFEKLSAAIFELKDGECLYISVAVDDGFDVEVGDDGAEDACVVVFSEEEFEGFGCFLW
jgi:hypothetical protein